MNKAVFHFIELTILMIVLAVLEMVLHINPVYFLGGYLLGKVNYGK